MASNDQVLVQIASYNTNLQGLKGVPQDLVDWLAPTLQVSSFLSRQRRAPDIIAVGFQELLPLHLGLCGFSQSIIDERAKHILSEIEKHAPNKESYSLLGKVENVGIALLIYARDDGLARSVSDVQVQWTGCGPAYMGNKGAVGIRFRVASENSGSGEIYTFVCAHLTAHKHKLARRIADYHYIVRSLLFPPLPHSKSRQPTTMFSTSHLFWFGDLNFHVALPPSHPLSVAIKQPRFAELLEAEARREQMRDFDQLLQERNKQSIFITFKEGEFWRFKCSYKYKIGHVDEYNPIRIPSWTDRIMYTTYADSPDTPHRSNITNILYTSVPSYTTSDHKPVVSVLLLPPSTSTSSAEPPLLRLPEHYKPVPDRLAPLKRYVGRAIDRMIGICWYLLIIMGAGSAVIGAFNFIISMGVMRWWQSRPSNQE